ncbi:MULTISPECIES: glycosyltransferase [Pseudomonas]|uniref:glycosyltransferase family protein n=1 Tax=Pseudomonadaceae TaxID=135621 RepID=UPI0010F5A852|nr:MULTISPECIES: glycosyltransferase [Pseudomonas]MDE3737579.1 glycosyltransferase [Pseudomonas resinovorans]
MKVLALSSAGREPDFSCVYGRLREQVDLDLKILDKDAQRNLRRTLSGVDLSAYDRILVDLHFKNIHRQTRFLSRLSGLLIYEEDACQNYLDSSRWRGRFSRFYRALPNARIVVTGASVAERLRGEGFKVHFIPKGYDPRLIFLEGGERDIELGFIGRTASAAYQDRKRLLDRLAAEDSLQLLRTAPGEPYRKMLNRIRYFISADVGLGEYMAKNFEAMACGCVLLAWRQGSEEPAIGLEDGVHLLLYSDVDELRGHLARLREDSSLEQSIAEAGRRFVEQHLSHLLLAEHLLNVLEEPWPSIEPISVWQAFWSRINPN